MSDDEQGPFIIWWTVVGSSQEGYYDDDDWNPVVFATRDAAEDEITKRNLRADYPDYVYEVVTAAEKGVEV